MKTAHLRRDLAALGAVFQEGKKHTKVWLSGRQTVIPRHREIPDLLARKIKAQLGVK